MPPTPKVAIVVLNWNGWEDTRECLESLKGLTYLSFEAYAVDNGSTDGSPDRIADSFPEVRLLRLPENRGFAGGMNAGLKAALKDGHDFVLCLNNDMIVDPGLLEPLVATAIGEKVVPYPAIYQYGHRGVLDNVGQRINLFTGMTWMVAHGSRRLPESIEADYTEVPLFSRELLEVLGGWKEEYFALYEDADLCLRIQRAGWKVVCVPEAKVYHKRGRTAGRVPGLVSYYSIRNRLLVVRSHGTKWHYLTTLLHILLLTIPYIGLHRLLTPNYKHSLRHVLLGLTDGLFPWRRRISRAWQMSGPNPSVSRR
ncbi:MAG: glycosyltransferase family 2 protein [Candidatus Geothermarchaeales archaeon]